MSTDFNEVSKVMSRLLQGPTILLLRGGGGAGGGGGLIVKKISCKCICIKKFLH